jgi:gas vesicle protein
MATEQNDAAGYLGWFFLGGIVGAAAALLLTPKTGRETRDLLAARGGDLAKRAQEMAQGRAGEWLDKSRELFEEQTQRLMSAFEAGKDAMREEMRRGGPGPEIRKGPTPPRA